MFEKDQADSKNKRLVLSASFKAKFEFHNPLTGRNYWQNCSSQFDVQVYLKFSSSFINFICEIKNIILQSVSLKLLEMSWIDCYVVRKLLE